MTGRIEHDAQLLRVTVWWLVGGDRCAKSYGALDGRIDVIDSNLEMEHFRLGPGLFGPDWRLVPRLGLKQQAHTPFRIAYGYPR